MIVAMWCSAVLDQTLDVSSVSSQMSSLIRGARLRCWPGLMSSCAVRASMGVSGQEKTDPTPTWANRGAARRQRQNLRVTDAAPRGGFVEDGVEHVVADAAADACHACWIEPLLKRLMCR